ncbi:phage tail protein [Candidatus Symbiopectobacterium sp. NZEC135]|uniref:phage tail protein n=2 Tax=ant, tsetse, mealybug, aphid, etc. endosymbionts TaxID=84563 RepID=UPI002227C628|nr:phage tail protein [Candidatus Symbiopectobacterium sp. NZEC135]MCW2480485.1 phage tail protein [Candidatus Symbiopectobacterium sp. NZEC135]
MALEEYVGAIILEINGQEIECTDLKEDTQTGRKPVKTMNKTGRSKGFSRGIREYQVTVSVVIPLSGDLDWEGMEGVKITQYPLSGSGGKKVSYLDAYSTQVGAQYTVDNEGKRDITFQALRRVEE